MKEQCKPTRSLGRRTAAATLTAALVAVPTTIAGPAHAAPAPASATVSGDNLVITGTLGDDVIGLTFPAAGSNSVVVNFGDGRPAQTFDRRDFHRVAVALRSGNDQFRTSTAGGLDLPETVEGGEGRDHVLGGAANDLLVGDNGDDVLLGGAGSDQLVGGRGDDFVNGNVGTDTEVLGSGDDTAAWIPGEGNDVVHGETGTDTLQFTGAGGDEQMSLAADGSKAVFLRTQGNIRMDLDGVERLDLATLGGADTVTIGDLSGTDLVDAHVDLGSTPSTPDNKTDTVAINGTDAADRISVTADGDAVDVAGLAARTVITGSEVTDGLEINTLGGNDHLDVDPAVNALINIAVDLGTGQL